MSKSLGNFTTISDVLADWPGEVVRFNMLKTHYRQPIDWTVKGLEESRRTLDRWYSEVGDVEPSAEISPTVLASLRDDLNTPAAISELHRLASPAILGRMVLGVSRLGQPPQPQLLKNSANLLGLLQETASKRRAEQVVRADVSEVSVRGLIDLRLAARAAKNWAESDRIRDELKAMGVQLKDNKDGTTTWEGRPLLTDAPPSPRTGRGRGAAATAVRGLRLSGVPLTRRARAAPARPLPAGGARDGSAPGCQRSCVENARSPAKIITAAAASEGAK